MQLKLATDHILRRISTEFPEGLFYHDASHTLDVIRAASRLCRMECTGPGDRDLIHTAAAFHDAGFITSYDGHETQSIRLAEEILPGYGYDAEQIRIITHSIRATEAGAVPDNLFSRILCDADLDYLGRTDFIPVSQRLRKEWALRGTVYTERDWLLAQLNFLTGHCYYTASARILRGPGKEANIRILRQSIASL